MGLTISGKPIRSAASHAPATVVALQCQGVRMPAASRTCFIRSLSRNGTVCSTVMPGQPERLAEPRREDHVRLPQALDLVDADVLGQPAQRAEHRVLVGQRDVLVVREGLPRGGRQRVRRLVADADDRGADRGEAAGEVGHLQRVARREHDDVHRRLHQLDPDAADDPLQRILTTPVSGWRTDDVALALVARTAGWPGCGSRASTTRWPSSRCSSSEAVHRAGPGPCPWPAQVRRARGVPRARVASKLPSTTSSAQTR